MTNNNESTPNRPVEDGALLAETDLEEGMEADPLEALLEASSPPAQNVTRIQVNMTVEPGHVLWVGSGGREREQKIVSVQYTARDYGWSVTAYAADNSNCTFHSGLNVLPKWFPPPPAWFLPAAEALRGSRDE